MIGTRLQELDTPALLLDMAALEHNIGVIAEHYRGRNIRLRPHGKNHKCPRILAMQIEAGGTVGGVCAAKVSEAEAFVHAGAARNVLVANQVVAPRKIRRLAALAHAADVMVAIDHEAQIERLEAGARDEGATLGVVIEIDTTMGRGGVRSIEQAVALARRVGDAPHLAFRGVMSHQTPSVAEPTPDERFAQGGRAIGKVLAAKRAIEAAGIAVEVVSTGESWTYDVAATYPEVTEIEGGTYVVMEMAYGYMTQFRQAVRIMGRMVARPDAKTAIGDIPIDAIGAPRGLPSLADLPGVNVAALDHHGVTLKSDGEMPLGLGEPFFLRTHQQDMTMNRWDRFLGVRDGRVCAVFHADARGCVH